jgi:hypothetical protein
MTFITIGFFILIIITWGAVAIAIAAYLVSPEPEDTIDEDNDDDDGGGSPVDEPPDWPGIDGGDFDMEPGYNKAHIALYALMSYSDLVMRQRIDR